MFFNWVWQLTADPAPLGTVQYVLAGTVIQRRKRRQPAGCTQLVTVIAHFFVCRL